MTGSMLNATCTVGLGRQSVANLDPLRSPSIPFAFQKNKIHSSRDRSPGEYLEVTNHPYTVTGAESKQASNPSSAYVAPRTLAERPIQQTSTRMAVLDGKDFSTATLRLRRLNSTLPMVCQFNTPNGVSIQHSQWCVNSTLPTVYQFNTPNGVAIDQSRNNMIADTGNNRETSQCDKNVTPVILQPPSQW